MQKNFVIDKSTFQRTEEQLSSFLQSAIINYISCLQLSDQNDLLIYR